MDKPEILPTFSRPPMAGIEHRHTVVGFFLPHRLSGMKSQSGFLKFIIRFGYLAKGAVYLAVGLLALEVAVGFRGKTGDTKGALEEIRRRPFGGTLLVISPSACCTIRRGSSWRHSRTRKRRQRPSGVVWCNRFPPYLSHTWRRGQSCRGSA